MIRIAFVITGLSTGGAEMMLYKLLQNIDRNRFDPIVFSLIDKGEIGSRIESLGIPVCSLGMKRGIANPLLVLRLAHMIWRFKPNVVHTWMYHADLIGGLAARISGCRNIIWCLRNSDLSSERNSPTTLFVVKLCSMFSAWLPVQIVSCSSRASTVHVEVGYCASKMHVIPNGFDLKCFHPDSAARECIFAELSLPQDALLVGLVARYDVQKNHMGFIDAASRVCSQLPNVYFLMAGKDVDSSNSELMEAIASHSGLAEHMRLLGRRDDMPRLMASLDVLASSSHGEAFPNVLGEAMACGVPCVVTDVGDSAEIVGETGCVVSPGDMNSFAFHIVEILRLSSEDRRALGLKARARVDSRYEICHVTALYEELYARIASC